MSESAEDRCSRLEVAVTILARIVRQLPVRIETFDIDARERLLDRLERLDMARDDVDELRALEEAAYR